jgi:hypothetical protein
MRTAPFLVFASGILLVAVPALANELTNGRITVDFNTDKSSKTMDRVDSITWIDSDGVQSGNFVSAGGPTDCGDPQEYFGQSYGDNDGTNLFMVVAGANARWKSSSASSGTSKTTGKDSCFTLSGKTTTAYSLSAAPKQVSEMTIKRTFAFASDASFNLRAYVPRISDGVYLTEYYQDSAGVVQTANLANCPALPTCEISDWNGAWVADDDGHGNGIVLIRDKASAWPAEIGIDYDNFSAANATSIVLMRPSDGWSGKKVTEVEHLCFYDAKSWPARKRNAGKLPTGCTVKTP